MANVYVRSGAGGAGTGADWTNAYTKLITAGAAKAAGDDFWLSEDDAETQATAMTIAMPGTAAAPNRIFGVNHAGSVPPVSADLATTATISTTGASTLTLSGHFYAYGLTLIAGDAANTASLTLASAAGNSQVYENCNLVLGNSNGASGLFAAGFAQSSCKWINCTAKFGGALQGIYVKGNFTWERGSIDAAGALPTTLFPTLTVSGKIILEDVDLSALSGKTLFAAAGTGAAYYAQLKRCKLPASITIAAAQTGGFGQAIIDLIQCDNGSLVSRTERYGQQGSQVTSTAVVRTGGASDGATPISWKISTNANAKFLTPYVGLQPVIWNTVTGSNINITIEGIADPRDFSALPNNDEIWFEAEYLGTSGNPLGVILRGSKADPLAAGSALTASTQAWDSAATARANSTVYSAGDIRKVASNPGRLFVCTTGGTSAGSEPGGYSTAVDGGSVTDGTATFKAMWRFKQTLTTTAAPTFAGFVYVTPKVGKASLNGVYVDPAITLS